VKGALDDLALDVAAETQAIWPGKLPLRIRNSPANPFINGKPTKERVVITNKVASQGVRLAKPP